MSRVIDYPAVPQSLLHVQDFLIDTLKDRYYTKQSLRNLGLALIKFFATWAEKDKENYHVRVCTLGDVGTIEVSYKERGNEIIIMIIKQGEKNDNCN